MNDIGSMAKSAFSVFAVIAVVMIIGAIIIMIVNIVNHSKIQGKMAEHIDEYEKDTLEQMDNDKLPPLSQQFENEIYDDIKKVYKIKCSYCGTKYKSNEEKCPNCGASNDE